MPYVSSARQTTSSFPTIIPTTFTRKRCRPSSPDTNFVVPNFQSGSVEKYLRSMGFNNLRSIDFLEVWQLTPGFDVSILKSGDFRDDAGFFFRANDNRILMTVDANFLNGYVLPESIDLLMTSFASGASGFPLCFDDYSADEKRQILKRSKRSKRWSVEQYITKTKAKHYMPYAGMFAESAPRDKAVLGQNVKTSPEAFEAICRRNGATFHRPDAMKELRMRRGQLEVHHVAGEFLPEPEPSGYIENLKEKYVYDPQAVVDYLRNSGFVGPQVLQLIPTDDDFEPSGESVVFADFQHGIFDTIQPDELLVERAGCRVMRMRVRPEVLMCVVAHKMPWEDMSIGFQIRVERYPNEYESDFWYHFTNVYIGGKDFRYANLCGACTVFEQNPVWLKDPRAGRLSVA